MRVLVSGKGLLSLGGAEKSLYIFCRWLHKRHHVIFYGDVDERFRKVVFSYTKWKPPPDLPLLRRTPLQHLLAEFVGSSQLRRAWAAYEPDIYICNETPWILLPTLWQLRNAPSMLFIRAPFWAHNIKLDFELNQKYPLHKRLIAQATSWIRALRSRQLVHHFDLIIANSRFIQNSLSKLGLASDVVYPFMELDEHLVPDKSSEDSRFITFVKCSLAKGLAVAYEVARRLPEYRFLFVGFRAGKEWRQKVNSLPNVTVWQWQQDMRKVWRVTKILLVPSLWREPFGRVPVEAGINGIPSIASRIGGLPESVGDGGILIAEPMNVEMWCEAVRKVVEDNDLRQHLGERARRHAEELRAEVMLERFRNIVWRKLGIRL